MAALPINSRCIVIDYHKEQGEWILIRDNSDMPREWSRVELDGCSRDKLRTRAMDLRDAVGLTEEVPWAPTPAPQPDPTQSQ